MGSPSSFVPVVTRPKSGNAFVESLAYTEKYAQDGSKPLQLTFSFPYANGPAVWETWNEEHKFEVYAFDAVQQQAARNTLKSWSDVANIIFTEIPDTSSSVGDIRFGFSSRLYGEAWAWASTPLQNPAAGDIWFNPIARSFDDWSVGGSNYVTLIHEIGHALGLKHPFGFPPFPIDFNSVAYSVMAYYLPPGYAIPTTPMVYDILAIQSLYGANTSYNAGNDVYRFDASTAWTTKTIWDAGGIDIIDVSGLTEGCTLSLVDGTYSTIPVASNDRTSTLGIAFNAIIENATGGSGNDSILGNAVGNELRGGAGNDTLDGAGGNDWLTGGVGNDVLIGDDGIDFARYSGKQSLYSYTKNADGSWTVTGAEGDDTLSGIEWLLFADRRVFIGEPTNTVNGSAMANMLLGTAAPDLLRGLGGNDMLLGMRGNDTLDGGDGNDTLGGGDGNDSLDGGAGIDVASYSLDQSRFAFQRSADGSLLVVALGSLDGRDILRNMEWIEFAGKRVAISTLTDSVIGTHRSDVLVNTGTADRMEGLDGNDSLVGGDRNEVLNGGSGDDNLAGIGGNDTLSGGSGNDTLYGGLGDDLLDGGAGEDVARYEIPISLLRIGVSAEGLWTVTTPADYDGSQDKLSNVEWLEYYADTQSLAVARMYLKALQIDGTVRADRLNGTPNSEFLNGLAGNDTLDGGGGRDTLHGGDGVDTALFAREASAYAMWKNADGSIAVADIQNALDANVLRSMEWLKFADRAIPVVDVKVSGFIGTMGGDSIVGSSGADWILGLAGDDTIHAGSGDDSIVGGDGFNQIYGDDGNDVAWFDWSMDYASFFLNGEEFWKVGKLAPDGSWSQITELHDVEWLQFTDKRLGISELVETVAGTPGNDVLVFVVKDPLLLRGLDGDDYLHGGFGNDTLDGGNGIDTATFFYDANAYTIGLSADGFMTVTAQAGVSDTTEGADTLKDIEFIKFSDIKIAVIYGDNSNNAMIGGDGADFMVGLAGNDVVLGLDGSDTLLGGAGNDTLWGADGDDLVDGGNDIDTAFFALNLSSYSFHKNADGFWTVKALEGSEGTDTLRSIELVSFNDYNLTIGELVNTIIGTAGPDGLSGTADADRIDGLAGDDGVFGFAGNDILNGGDGNDGLVGGSGDDTLDGGAGDDTAYYAMSHSEYVFQKSPDGSWIVDALSGDEGRDLLRNIEWLSFSDKRVAASSLQSTIIGTAGSDKLIGTSMSEFLYGLAGNDNLDGGAGNDIMDGGAGNDVLIGGAGADALNGGSGFDEVRYTAATTVNLMDLRLNTGDALGDVYSGIEAFVFGTGNDKFRGGDGAVLVRGGDGNDTLEGGIGNDILQGGNGTDSIRGGVGQDWLYGGAGADRFVFQADDGGDVIADYDAQDVLQMSSLGFGNLKSVALGSSLMVNANPLANGARPTFLFDTDTGALTYDRDGTGTAAAVNICTLVGVKTIDPGDFLFV